MKRASFESSLNELGQLILKSGLADRFLIILGETLIKKMKEDSTFDQSGRNYFDVKLFSISDLETIAVSSDYDVIIKQPASDYLKEHKMDEVIGTTIGVFIQHIQNEPLAAEELGISLD